jgi:protease YdgD
MKTTRLMMSSAALALALACGTPALAQDIDFGDNSSTWANDDQCDDPRFEGPGAALIRSPVDEMRDAVDCQAAFEAGEITLVAADAPASLAPEDAGEIDFGDDSGAWANDGECDDPRFGGSLSSHEMADATDCRTAYEAGEVTYTAPSVSDSTATPGEIDFGDDTGSWANDGECDDPRFGGGLDSHRLADATDCRAALEAGEVTYLGDSSSTMIDDIDFGDDSGTYANDGECDDPRFTGSGVGVALADHLMADATDCSTAYTEGTVTLADEGSGDGSNGDFRINFGDDSSASAYDGVCDDPRFQGRGGALELLETNMLADATDCRAAYDAGTVTYNP